MKIKEPDLIKYLAFWLKFTLQKERNMSNKTKEIYETDLDSVFMGGS